MERFYSEVLGLDLIWKSDTDIAYMINGHQLLISLDEELVKGEEIFAKQPGWEGGSASRTSWSIEYDAPDFVQIIETCKGKPDIITRHDEAKWEGYWSFPILDPMNNTIELTCTIEDLGS